MNKIDSPITWWKNPTLHYFQKLFEKQPKIKVDDDETYLLNDLERAELQKTKHFIIFWAACYGACGVIFLYVPFYVFPFLFPSEEINLYGIKFPFSLSFTIYGLFLAVLEIVLLIVLNLKSVIKVGHICNFPDVKDRNFDRNFQVLYEVSIEKQATELLDFDINPMEGLSTWQIMIYNIWNKVKATLSNMIIKMLVGRILGRFMVRYSFLHYFVDFISLPIFAFWDAYTSYRVFRETKVRVLATGTIQNFVVTFKRKFYDDEKFKSVLLDCLRFIAIAKRSFHHNHYLLAENIVHSFDLVIDKDRKKMDLEFLLKSIQELTPEARVALAKLFILGMLIDGYLSKRDWYILKNLDKKDEIINFTYQDLKRWEQEFIKGYGLNNLLTDDLH
ncbi:MAG: hypothetical protein EAZ85_07720 [Bacteroidetes bacterium]|nr:MAG: hypothetical protein EAZ85_07720 [Bacteroidota bacterium]TAG86520.1 MAG: hypothetical protein EAZ20_12585 [Bacteroidota bacterium]